MLERNFVLGDGDAALAKVAFWVIAFIIWGVGSAVSALKKKSGQIKQMGSGDEVAIDLTPRMEMPAQQMAPLLPPPPPPPPGLRPVSRPVGNPMQRKAKVSLKPVQVRKLPPPLVPERRPMVAASPPMSANPAAAASQTSRATQLSKSLRPESLRAQWILTEVLAKPLALREIDGLGSR